MTFVMDDSGSFNPASITRAAPLLMRYYFVISLLTLVAFPFVLLAHSFKYRSLRYRFDDDGISMSWGVLFRREINLTYRRIQDIHLTRNLIERWMGLSKVAVQTASGSSSPEMTIVGIPQAAELRDYLYSRMRGAKGEDPAGGGDPQTDEALRLLREIRDEVRTARGKPAP